MNGNAGELLTIANKLEHIFNIHKCPSKDCGKFYSSFIVCYY